MWTRCLVFIHINVYCIDRKFQPFFCEFIIWSWYECFLSETNQNKIDRSGCLNLFKSFTVWYFLLSFMACDKKMALSHLVWEIANVFMHYLPDKKRIHSYVPGCGLEWLAGIVANQDLDVTNKFLGCFQIRTIRVRLLSCHTFEINNRLIQLIYCKVFRLTQKSSYLGIRTNAKRYSLPFLNFWSRE